MAAIRDSPEADRLRTLVQTRLRQAGFKGKKHLRPGATKDDWRRVHQMARAHEISKRLPRINQLWAEYGDYFADGLWIQPASIKPRLHVIDSGSHWNNLFYLARMTWSLPFSQGYGRRLRALVWDDHTDCIMGLIGLQSPPIRSPLRDKALHFTKTENESDEESVARTALVNQTMDAYTLGAVPPFNDFLAGKLASMAVNSTELRKAYEERYTGAKTELAGREIPARLLAVTTTSAYGKSSQYARIRRPDESIMYERLGMIENPTGTSHFNGLYDEFRKILQATGTDRKWSGYGTGPNVRTQILRQGLRALGLNESLLEHHVPRELYLVRNADNIAAVVENGDKPEWNTQPFDEIAAYWTRRWLQGRAKRIEAEPHRKIRLEGFHAESLVNQLRLVG